MKRIGFQVQVKKETLAEYIEHHKHVWPEMLQALSESGWHNYSLFMREDGLMFGYFEADKDLADSQARMAVREVNDRWQAFMAPYFESEDNAHPDTMFKELPEIFHLD